MKFTELLQRAWSKNNSLLCVGLDTDPKLIPGHLLSAADPIFEFNRGIIDATADLVCAFKPQIAYYAACGAEISLANTIQYIKQNYPDIPVILDAKRNDIGSTAQKYAIEAFERYEADAVTVNPYLGTDGIKPFLDYSDKGVIVLCRTSNPSAREFQDLEIQGKKLYRWVAEQAAASWNEHGNCLLVIGATYPEELAEIRSVVGDMPLLVPGVGAQGGSVEKVLKNGATADGTGLIINSSRAIIYASNGADYAEAACRAAQQTNAEINAWRPA